MAAREPDQLVLDDELFILYTRFNSGMDAEDLDKETKKNLFALLSKIKLPVARNASQIKRCYTQLPESLRDGALEAIMASGTEKNLEDSAIDTVHGVILTTKETNIPYINIHDKDIDANFSISFAAGQQRDNLIRHIRRLASTACKLHVFDKYLYDGIKRHNVHFEKLLPNKHIEVVCHDGINKRSFSALKHDMKNKNVENSVRHMLHSYTNMHDRYLIIEYPSYTYEVILSSGFEFLFSDAKEITCVFRKK